MKRPGAQLSVNFGEKPFVFDIDEMVAVSGLPVAFISTNVTEGVIARKERHQL